MLDIPNLQDDTTLPAELKTKLKKAFGDKPVRLARNPHRDDPRPEYWRLTIQSPLYCAVGKDDKFSKCADFYLNQSDITLLELDYPAFVARIAAPVISALENAQ